MNLVEHRVLRCRRPPRPSTSRLRQTATVVLLALALAAPWQDVRAQVSSATAPEHAPLRSWDFAEGNSRNGFETFFSLLNLSDQPASVTAVYSRDDGIRLTQWLGIEPRARVSLNANAVVGMRAFGASFFSDQEIVVERSTIWGPGQNGATTIGFAPDGKRAWYFAEGTTRGQTTTYFVTQNLSDAPTTVTATFVPDGGAPVQRQFSLGPRARDAYRVNELLADTAFSATFRSDQDIVVERTILIEGERPPALRRPQKGQNGQTDDSFASARNTLGIFGGLGYVSSLAEPGSRRWEFAEGSTRGPYRTTFVLMNPGQQSAAAQLLFRLQNGETRTLDVQVPAQGRAAVDSSGVVPPSDFATSISSDRPIVAERQYASDGDGLFGTLGYTASGGGPDSRVWYFADGNTTGQIELYFVLFNLSAQAAQVRTTYLVEGGQRREQTLDVAPNGRLAVRANDAVPNSRFSAQFKADQNVVIERTLYLPGRSGFVTVGSGAGRP